MYTHISAFFSSCALCRFERESWSWIPSPDVLPRAKARKCYRRGNIYANGYTSVSSTAHVSRVWGHRPMCCCLRVASYSRRSSSKSEYLYKPRLCLLHLPCTSLSIKIHLAVCSVICSSWIRFNYKEEGHRSDSLRGAFHRRIPRYDQTRDTPTHSTAHSKEKAEQSLSQSPSSPRTQRLEDEEESSPSIFPETSSSVHTSTPADTARLNSLTFRSHTREIKQTKKTLWAMPPCNTHKNNRDG